MNNAAREGVSQEGDGGHAVQAGHDAAGRVESTDAKRSRARSDAGVGRVENSAAAPDHHFREYLPGEAESRRKVVSVRLRLKTGSAADTRESQCAAQVKPGRN